MSDVITLINIKNIYVTFVYVAINDLFNQERKELTVYTVAVF